MTVLSKISPQRRVNSIRRATFLQNLILRYKKKTGFKTGFLFYLRFQLEQIEFLNVSFFIFCLTVIRINRRFSLLDNRLFGDRSFFRRGFFINRLNRLFLLFCFLWLVFNNWSFFNRLFRLDIRFRNIRDRFFFIFLFLFLCL